MKNEYLHMQALHRKLDVLVQILPSVQNPISAFARIRPPQQDSALYPGAGLAPHYFFSLRRPCRRPIERTAFFLFIVCQREGLHRYRYRSQVYDAQIRAVSSAGQYANALRR